MSDPSEPPADTGTRPRLAAVQRNAARHPLALVAFGVFLYSTGPVFVQASALPGPAFSTWRLWFGVPTLGLITLIYLRAGGRWPDRRALRWPLWAGLCFGTHQVLFMSALKATSVADATLIGTLQPVFIALTALPLFGERPGTTFRLWTLVAMAGTAVVVLAGSTGPEGNPLGMAMAVANVIAFGGFFLFSKLGRDDIDVLPFLFGVMTVAAVAVTAFSLATAQPLGAATARDLVLAAALAVGAGTLGHFVMTWPLRWVPANVPPVMRLAQPVLAASLAWIFLGEGVTLAHLGGGTLTLAGVAGALLAPSGRRFAAGTADTDLPPLDASGLRRKLGLHRRRPAPPAAEE